MPQIDPTQLDIVNLENVVWLATAPVDLPSYDFQFDSYFSCRRPLYRAGPVTAIGRFGVSSDYAALYHALLELGVALIHSNEQHLTAAELPRWYPSIANLTPKSYWFTEPPAADEIEQLLGWPLFLKGSRQTSRKQAALSIIRTQAEYVSAAERYRTDPTLRWQAMVCREFVELRPVSATVPDDYIRPSFEFRTFWYKGQCVGAGPRRVLTGNSDVAVEDKQAGLPVAGHASQQLNFPFRVIDVAQTQTGQWIVIECNDAQESGYTGVPPYPLWQNVLKIERESRLT